MKKRMRTGPSRPRADTYRNIFLHSMVSLWVEDISKLRAMIRSWRARGISDLRAYLESHPRILRKAVQAIEVVDVNDVTLQLYEARERRELLGPLHWDAESMPRRLSLILAIAEGQHQTESESTALTLRGRKLDILTRTWIPAEGDEDPLALVSIFDVSERKRLDQKLAEERALLRAVIDNIPDQVFLKDREGRFLVVNKALAQWADAADPSELVGKSDLDLFPREVAEKFRKDDQAILRSGVARPNIEEQISSASGSQGWALTTKAPVRDPAGRVFGVVGIVRDITERKKFEQILGETEERYRAIFTDAPVGIFHSSLGGKLLNVNPAYARMLGYDSPEQIIEAVDAKSMIEILHVDPAHRSRLIDALTRQTGWHTSEVQLRRRDGSLMTAQLSIRLHVAPGTSEPALEGFLEDITERRDAEQALSRERAFLTALMDNIPDYIYFKDRESRFILNNKAHAREMGAASPAEMRGKTDLDYFARAHAQKTFDDERRIIQTGRPLVNDLEEEIWTDRSPTWVSSTKMPLKDESGEIIGTFGISRDMTEQRALQTQIIRSQRLESLGTLSAGIAHQFNNINSVTVGYLDLMARDTTLPSSVQSYVQEALKAVQRAVEITERLQGLTSAAALDAESLRLEEEMPAFLPLVEEKLKAGGISIQLDLQETSPVRATRMMLSFIVTSLLTNSIHALLDCPSRLIMVRTRSGAKFSALEVSDTGCGILPENLPRIFTPFFTTKGEWAEPNSAQSRVKGIGLSLAVCQSTISESGGWIEVESSPKLGSTFRVWFPAADGQSP